MAFGRTAEQKVADENRKAAERVAKEQERARREFLETPIGQATIAKEQNHGFFEIELEVGSSQRDSTVWRTNDTNIPQDKTETHAGTLAAIEAIGWRLEHVGHVFVVTSESSYERLLGSGEQTAVSGETIGIYLFRNTD